MTEQIIIFFQIVFIDLVLAGDNAIIIGMVASQFQADQRKKIIFFLQLREQKLMARNLLKMQ